MNIAMDLLLILVTFLLLMVAGFGIVALIDWWQMRKPVRVPPPPLSNDERIRLYEINERAQKGLR